jgi:DNA-binding CsgD family transcriptional regulator
MPASDILSRLTNLVGEAAVDPKAWPAAVDGLTDALHASQSVLSIQDAKTNAVSVQAPRIDPIWVRAYAEHWAERNFLWQRGHSEPAGRLLRYENFLPRGEFDRTEFYNEFLRPQGQDVGLATHLAGDGSASCVIAFYRDHGRGQFGAEEEQLLSALVPHLRAAVRLHLRLARSSVEQTGLTAAVLNQLDAGALVVDRWARVLFANRLAESVLNGGTALMRGRGGEKLTALWPDDTSTLRRLIARCAGDVDGDSSDMTGGALALRRGEGQLPLLLRVAPVRAELPWTLLDRPVAVIFVRDPEAPEDRRAERLRALFRLTPAEAAVALRVARGEGLPAVAEAFGVGRSTVRTHLQHVFEKVGTHRQAELARMLAQLP